MTEGPRLRLLALPLACLALGCGPDPVITADDGSVMILIAEGEFPMGGKEEELTGAADANMLTYHAERPVHRVLISAYYIDKHEVTNKQYRRFLGAIDGSPQWDHPDQPQDQNHEQRYLNNDLRGDLQPAVGVNWYDSYSYCGWAGKRLPTEAEWEYAARGRDYRKYPWGDGDPYSDGIWWANFRPASGHSADGYRWSATVGSYPDGVSPFGIMDMSGNAEEWVQDWHSVGYYKLSEGAQDPPGPVQGRKRVIKGGSYGAPARQIRIGMRITGNPKNKGQRIGFRCAMDP